MLTCYTDQKLEINQPIFYQRFIMPILNATKTSNSRSLGEKRAPAVKHSTALTSMLSRTLQRIKFPSNVIFGSLKVRPLGIRLNEFNLLWYKVGHSHCVWFNSNLISYGWELCTVSSTYLKVTYLEKLSREKNSRTKNIQSKLSSIKPVFYCSDFRYESNGIFVLGVGFFSSDKFRLFH